MNYSDIVCLTIIIAFLGIGLFIFSSGTVVDTTDSSDSVVSGSSISRDEPEKMDLYCDGVEEDGIADVINLDFGKILVTSEDTYSLDINDRVLVLSSDSNSYSYNFIRVYQDSVDLESLDLFGLYGYSVAKAEERVLDDGVSSTVFSIDGASDMSLIKYCVKTDNAYGDFVYYVLENHVGHKDLDCTVFVGSEKL